MWLEKIKELTNGNLSGPLKHLNLNMELHAAIYLIETLEGIFEFSLKEDEFNISKGETQYSKDEFLFWWQITRYQEITNEERKLIDSFKEVEKKMIKLQKMLPKIENEDKEKEKEKKQKKIEDINIKLSKLANWLNHEGPILKQNLQILSNYRNIFSTEESLNEIIKWVEFYLKYK